MYLSFFSCQKKEEGVKPFYSSITESVYATGTLQSADQYVVYSEMSGILEDVQVEEGEEIKKGQLLFAIKSSVADVQKAIADNQLKYNTYEQNKARLDEIRASIDQARLKRSTDSAMYMRQKDLYANGVGSEVELEQRELAFKTSKAAHQALINRLADADRQIKLQADQARLQKKSSELQAGMYRIHSLMDGRVYAIHKTKGEWVNQTMPLATIGHARRFVAPMQVDERDIQKIALGQTVYMRMEAMPDTVFVLQVTKIVPYLQAQNRTFEVEAELENSNGMLYPNMSFEANIKVGERDKVLLVPSAAILRGDSVWLADGSKRKIKTGLRNYAYTEVLAGLDTTDRILIK